MARKTVARYRAWAQREGLLTGPLPPAEEFDGRLREGEPLRALPRPEFTAGPYREAIAAWRRQGVEVMTIFQRLRAEHGSGGSYPSVLRYVHHLEQTPPTGFVRLEVEPGAEAQVDFGGAGEIVDPRTGAPRKAWAFVRTLSSSRHQYATLVFDQRVATWLRCHREAFEAFGVVPRKIVLDNLKAAIVRAVLHEPVAQRSYRECAEHYGFLISPCRPRMARHKGKVESGVHSVKRSFLAGRTFRDITEATARLDDWVATTAGTRIHGTTTERPLARFCEVEQAALLPLPASPYDGGIGRKVKLHPDCHVVIDGAYYSAPHRLIGRTLWARTNGREVHLFHDDERVASHPWGPPGTRRTLEAHYPPGTVAFLLATPRFCRARAEEIGPGTAEVVGRLLDERPLDRLRTAQAVLRLAARYGAQRLEAACRRALCFGDVAYGTLKRILARGLEADPLPEVEPLPPQRRVYVFARPGSEIFAPHKEDRTREDPRRVRLVVLPYPQPAPDPRPGHRPAPRQKGELMGPMNAVWPPTCAPSASSSTTSGFALCEAASWRTSTRSSTSDMNAAQCW